MSNFMEEKEHYIFAEKYRPSKIDDYIGNEQLKTELKRIVESGQLNHLMLHGTCPGTGKTTAAKLIVNNIDCDYLYINASDTNGVDLIRDEIKSFAVTTGFSDIKVVILDEADFLTPAAQGALRNVIETFSLNCRFIFTCNYVEKIITPILSRCQVFEVIPPNKRDVAIHLKNILDKEAIKHTMDDIGYIINTYYPDIRKIINFSQQCGADGTMRIIKNNVVADNLKDGLLTLIKKYNAPTTFNEIRQLITDNGVKHYEELYQHLYENVKDYADGKETIIILIIAEYLYQSAMVVNKEITFMACIAKILKESQ